MNPLRLYVGLERDVYILFLARLVNAMGNFVFPFLTLLLVKKLGFSTADAGLVILVASACNLPGSIIGGKLADRIGRKPVIVVSQAIVVALYLPCAFFGASVVVVPFIIVAEIALGAAWPASNALLIDRSNRDNRQAAFSLIYLGFNLGFAVGLFLAGLLFDRHLPWIFLGNAISTFISMALVLVFVREKRRDAALAPEENEDDSPESGPAEEKSEAGTTLRVLLRRPYLLLFVATIFVLNFVYAQINFTLPLQISQVFPLNGSELYGTLMSATAVYVVVLTPIIVALTKRIHPLVNQVGAGVLYAVGFGSLGFIRSFPLYLTAAFVWTVGEVLFATNANVYIANHTPRSHRGRVNAVLPLIMGAGFAFNPPVMGRYLAAHAIAGVWPIMFVVGMVAVGALAALTVWDRRRRARAPSAAGERPTS